MTLYNELTIAIALIVACIIIRLIRRQRLGVYQTGLWLGAVIGLVLFGVFPGILDWLGGLLGVSYPPVLLVIVSLCVLLVKLLAVDIELSRHEIKLRLLTQKMAAYEAELAELKTRNDRTGKDNL